MRRARHWPGSRRWRTVIETLADGLALTLSEIPPEHDPRLVDGVGTRRKRLAALSPVQRAALVLECYPELRAFPNCDWERLSRQASFTILFGEAARHYARLQLAALAGVLASAGTSDDTTDGCGHDTFAQLELG